VQKAVARMVDLWTVEQYHHEDRALSGITYLSSKPVVFILDR
jgi:hypothetical protein